MKKRIMAILLCIVMMFSFCTVYANAIFVETIGVIGSFASIIGTGLSALQIGGVFGDDTSTQLKKMNKTLGEIKEGLQEVDRKLDQVNTQLNAIFNELGNVQKELNDISKSMTDLTKKQIASDMYQIISARNANADNMREAWRDFTARYKEPLDKATAEYESLILSSISEWCQYPDRRDADIIQNSNFIVTFKDETGELLQEFNYDNLDALEGLSDDLKYVVIDSELLPKAFIFNADTYRKKIVDSIASAILARKESGATFVSKGLPEFETGNISEEYARFIGNAAYNELVYRTACIEVNAKENNSFISNIKTSFDEYMTHLFEQNDGLDAFIQAEFMTHTFEYELKGVITDFCKSMQYLTAQYGLMTTDIMALSRLTKSREKTLNDFFIALDRNLNKITDIGEQSYTGHDNYCYITNSLIHLGKASYSYDASLKRAGSVQMTYGSSTMKSALIGKALDPESSDVNSSAVMLMYNTTKSIGDFVPLLKAIGAWEYDDIEDNGKIMLENGTGADWSGTDKAAFSVFNAVPKTVESGVFGYSDAVGNYTLLKADKIAATYLNTATGEIEPNGAASAILLVNTDLSANPLKVCYSPSDFNFKYSSISITQLRTLTGTGGGNYLYETNLKDDELGELSPLRHMKTLYLSSVYSSGNVWIIIVLAAVALIIIAGIVVYVAAKKKKAA